MIHKAPVAAELRGGNDGLLVVTIEFPRFALSAEIQTPNENFSLGPIAKMIVCHDVSWRATADEDGHYSFAVAL